ncbi:hypothetical protein HUU42_11370 [bacterium]|nr:hypothetical protein [bacterium]
MENTTFIGLTGLKQTMNYNWKVEQCKDGMRQPQEDFRVSVGVKWKIIQLQIF